MEKECDPPREMRHLQDCPWWTRSNLDYLFFGKSILLSFFFWVKKDNILRLNININNSITNIICLIKEQ